MESGADKSTCGFCGHKCRPTLCVALGLFGEGKSDDDKEEGRRNTCVFQGSMTLSVLIFTWSLRKAGRPCGERRTHRSGEGCPLGSARLKRRLRPTQRRARPCQGKVGTRIFRRFKAERELSCRAGDEWGAKRPAGPAAQPPWAGRSPAKPAAGGLPCGPYPGFFAGLGRGRKGLAGAGWGSGFWGELEAGREICADRAGKAGKTRGRQMTQRRRNAMGGICLL